METPSLKTETRTRVESRRPAPATGVATPTANTAAGRIRVLVADSQAIDRTGLVAMLKAQPDFLVVGEAATVADAVARCRELRPNVVVLTLSLPGHVGSTALTDLLGAVPDLRVVALSERGWENCLVLNPPMRSELPIVRPPEAACGDGTDCLQVAAAQGAMATIRRSADITALFAAIRTVADGRTSFEPGTVPAIAGQRAGSPGPALTARETQVALLLAEGLSNKEIATALVISEPTVKKHVGQVLAKLGLQDRLQAGLYVARHPLMFASRATAPRA